MIVVNDLVKRYGPHLAVDGVSFEVEKGEILGFLGPNGAGKTTTMRILTCFLPATSGSLSIAGFDVFNDSAEVRRRIGYLPENVPLYLDMTVEGYIGYMASLRGMDRTQLKRRVGEVIEACGLVDRRRQIINKLSRGYRQRVGLAQALVHEPDVLILDEPTASLDPAQIRDVREYIRSLSGNHTIILSTHILPEVEAVCDRVLVLSRGRLAFDGTLEAARTSRTIEIEVRGPSHPLLNAIRGVIGVESARLVRTIPNPNDPENPVQLVEIEPRGQHDPREDIAKVVLRYNWGLQRMDRARSSLETRFLEIARAN